MFIDGEPGKAGTPLGVRCNCGIQLFKWTGQTMDTPFLGWSGGNIALLKECLASFVRGL
jgi:hypothetical protein